MADTELLNATEQFNKNSFKNKLVNLLDSQFIAQQYSPHYYIMEAGPTVHDFGLIGNNNQPLVTTVWGYKNIVKGSKTSYSSPGCTIVAQRNMTINVLWLNNLPEQHLLPVDYSLHMAKPKVGTPTVTHLHGGLTADSSDGGPEAWFTPRFRETGDHFVQEIYEYKNRQPASHLFYHDHVMGLTRLNVYAGLVGNYFIRDKNEEFLIKNNQLPSYPYEYPLVLQEKQFTVQGELYYPATDVGISEPYPSVIPEFLAGPSMNVVNGKVWPYLAVEKRMYRFRFLNATQARFYNLYLRNTQGEAVNFIQLGTDAGFINSPTVISTFLLGPAMRQDMIIDFSNQEIGQKIYLLNDAAAPHPVGPAANLSVAMQHLLLFKVVSERNINYPRITLPQRLLPISELIYRNITNSIQKKRKLILAETMDKYGRMLPLLGTVDQGMKRWHDPPTEIVKKGETEEWEIYNTTKDSHTVHLHACSFSVKNRQSFKAEQAESGALSNIILDPTIMLPYKYEYGLVDTCISPPGMITRIVITFTLAGNYVWHCHMLEHEDNEMMRELIIE